MSKYSDIEKGGGDETVEKQIILGGDACEAVRSRYFGIFIHF